MGTDADDKPWTLERHLAAGRAAIARIAADQGLGTLQPVCHHFAETDPVDPERLSVERSYRSLTPMFEMLGLDFAADRLEAWERAWPTLDWMAGRVPTLVEVASEAGLRYEGWSWEPHGRQPVVATAFEIVNNRTD